MSNYVWALLLGALAGLGLAIIVFVVVGGLP